MTRIHLLSMLLFLMTNQSFSQANLDSSKNVLPKYSIKLGGGPNCDREYSGKTVLGFNTTVEINYLIKKHFTIGIGLDFTDYRDKYTSINNNLYYPNSNPSYNNPNNPFNSDYFITVFNAQAINIPLNFTYHLSNQKSGFFTGLDLGLGYNFRNHTNRKGYSINGVFNYEYTNTRYLFDDEGLEIYFALKAGYSFHLTKNISGFLESGITASVDNAELIGNAGLNYFWGNTKHSGHHANDSTRKKIKIHLMNPVNIFLYGGFGFGGSLRKNFPPQSDLQNGYNTSDTYLTAIKNKEQPGASWSLGFGMDLFRIGKTYINIGLEYRQINYQGTVLESEGITSANPNYVNPIYTITISSDPVKYYYSENFFLFPLTIKYPFKSNERLFFGIQTGIAVAASGEYYHGFGNTSDAATGVDLFIPRGLIYDKVITKSFEAFIEPELQVQPFGNGDGRTFYSLTLKTGIVFW